MREKSLELSDGTLDFELKSAFRPWFLWSLATQPLALCLSGAPNSDSFGAFYRSAEAIVYVCFSASSSVPDAGRQCGGRLPRYHRFRPIWYDHLLHSRSSIQPTSLEKRFRVSHVVRRGHFRIGLNRFPADARWRPVGGRAFVGTIPAAAARISSFDAGWTVAADV